MDLSSRHKKIIKICKVDNFEFAKYAIYSGAAYLGVHILNEHQIGKHLDLVKYIRSLNGEVVIVTKIEEYPILKKIIDFYNPQGLQLHFSPKLDLLSLLKKNHPTLKLFSVVTSETDTSLIEKSGVYSEKIIYDTSFVGGTGVTNDLRLLNQLSESTVQKILIAGGVNLDTIKNNTNKSIAGFDIQSYFRDGENRFFNRLESVFRELGYVKHGRLSISLTDVPVIDIDRVVEYRSQPQANYHLDYSDGSLYPDFITDKKESVEKTLKLKNWPHAIHIFQDSIEKINKTIKEFTESNPYSITSFFVQYFPDANLALLNTEVNIVISVYYKDIYEYLQIYGSRFKYISIILPSDDANKTAEIIDFINKHSVILKDSEIWYDRELTAQKIKIIKDRSLLPINVIVGKEITKNWSNLPLIYEQLSV